MLSCELQLTMFFWNFYLEIQLRIYVLTQNIVLNVKIQMDLHVQIISYDSATQQSSIFGLQHFCKGYYQSILQACDLGKFFLLGVV